MIDLVQAGAQQIDALPISPIYVRTLDEFDGPLLAEFKTEIGETLLYKWCDSGAGLNRWLIVRTPPQDVARYMVRRTSLYQLIANCRDQCAYIVDMDRYRRASATFFIRVSNIPVVYLPGQASQHDQGDVATSPFQDVYVDEAWGYHELQEYPKKYIQAYSFHGNFGELTVNRPPIVDYRLEGGYAYYQTYVKLESYLPVPQRAEIKGIASASPGYVRFSVDPEIAESLRAGISHFLADRETVTGRIRGLRAWYLGRDPLTDDQAKREIRAVCISLKLNASKLLQRADSPKTAARILASYVTRVAFLADQDLKGAAMMVGRTRTAAEEAEASGAGAQPEVDED